MTRFAHGWLNTSDRSGPNFDLANGGTIVQFLGDVQFLVHGAFPIRRPQESGWV